MNGWIHIGTAAALLLGACYGVVPQSAEEVEPAPVVAALDPAPLVSDPGRVTLHRLNRTEYDRTVRDLLGTTLQPARDFPPDDVGPGFDNNADVLTMSPLLFEMAERAAKELIATALREPLLAPVELVVEAEDADDKTGLSDGGEAWLMFTAGHRVAYSVEVPEPGRYRLEFDGWAMQAGDELVRARFRRGAEVLGEVEVDVTWETPGTFGIEVDAERGAQVFVIDLANPSSLTEGFYRNLTVDRFRLVGPVDFVPPGPDWQSPRARLLACDPDEDGEVACARQILENFATRAWRRPMALRARLGPTDRHKVDQYLEGVYALETFIGQLADAPLCTPPNRPLPTMSFPDRVRTMSELMAIALECDMTRVMSFMLAGGASNQTYDFIGVSGVHHGLSHHQDDQENLAAIQTINTWEVGELAWLLSRLDAIEEPGGTLLDNTLVYWSSEVEDGNTHAHTNLPILLAGGAGGRIPTGRHLVYDAEEPLADLYIAILEAFDVQVQSFGADGTGPLAGLLA